MSEPIPTPVLLEDDLVREGDVWTGVFQHYIHGFCHDESGELLVRFSRLPKQPNDEQVMPLSQFRCLALRLTSRAPELRRVIVISTAHITRELAEQWNSGDIHRTDAAPIPYGYWCPVYTDPMDVHPIVWDICQWVRATAGPDVSAIQFDTDGPLYPDLPRYDW